MKTIEITQIHKKFDEEEEKMSDLILDEKTEREIRKLEKQNGVLKKTCATDDPQSSEIKKGLEKLHTQRL